MAGAARPDGQGSFCEAPFSYAEIHGGGEVYLCCPRYSGNRSIGNIFKEPPAALWNSIAAQAIRRGVHDGSYRLCEPELCPKLVSGTLPRREEVRHWGWGDFAPVIDGELTILPKGPWTVKLCHDWSCNLSCPSCRAGMLVADAARQRQLDAMLHEFILPFLKDTRSLFLAGDGDPFASRHYRDIMRLTRHTHPAMEIGLHTNGVLCDERAWEECGLEGRTGFVCVSADAARAETYALVRRGGDHARLLRNLEFLAARRRSGDPRLFKILFVVQDANFAEMPDYVRLGRALGVDEVYFSLIRHWARGMDDGAYARAQIWRPDHPRHGDFLAVLRDPVFDDPRVALGDVTPYRHKAV